MCIRDRNDGQSTGGSNGIEIRRTKRNPAFDEVGSQTDEWLGSIHGCSFHRPERDAMKTEYRLHRCEMTGLEKMAMMNPEF